MFKNFMFAAFALVLGATAANAGPPGPCAIGGNGWPTEMCAGTSTAPGVMTPDSTNVTPVFDGNGNPVYGTFFFNYSPGGDRGSAEMVYVEAANGDLELWHSPACNTPTDPGCAAGAPWNLMFHSNTANKGATGAYLGVSGSWGVWKGSPYSGGTSLWGQGSAGYCSAHGNTDHLVLVPDARAGDSQVLMICTDGTQVTMFQG